MTVLNHPADGDLRTPSEGTTAKRRRAVLTAQMIGSLGLAAGGTAGGLLAQSITGAAVEAAAPLGALVLGAGFSASSIARVMARHGRTAGLLAAYAVGAAGAVIVVASAATGSLLFLLIGNAILGAGTTAVMLSRYVVADLSPPAQQGRAISRSLLAVTAGAVIGPNLLGPAGELATALHLPPPTGLYLLAVGAFVAAPAVLIRTMGAPPITRAPSVPIPRSSASGIGIAVLATGNLTMVAIMAVTPVQLHQHGHGLGVLGMVVSLHIGAMYVASPVLGRIVDRVGARPVASAGALVLVLVGVLPSLISTDGLPAATGVLVLLGLGWNTQVVAGSAMLGRNSSPAARLRGEARGELAMALAAGGGALVLASPLVELGGLQLLAGATLVLNVPLVGVLARRGAWPRTTQFVQAREPGSGIALVPATSVMEMTTSRDRLDRSAAARRTSAEAASNRQ